MAQDSRDEQDAESIAYRADKLHRWLKPLLENSAAAKGAYRFKDRQKSAPAVVAIVNAKRQHPDPARRKPSYSAREVTDASGFRIVCLFNREIPSALEQVIDLIRVIKETASGIGRFDDHSLKEILYYSSRSKTEPLSIFPDVRKVAERKGLLDVFGAPEAHEGERSSSYSSVHVIVQGHIKEDPASRGFTACSEIQIRSVFEEAWGEINHRLIYSRDKRQWALGGGSVPLPARPDDLHLDALKSLTDGCAQYADLIDVALSAEREPQAERKPQSFEPPDKLLSPFRSCPDEIFTEIQRAFQLEKEAESSPPETDAQGQRFLAAGVKFKDAITLLNDGTASSERDRQLTLLQEEVGYCYMFSRNTQLKSEAEEIFEQLVAADAENAFALVRLAQLRRDADDLETARTLLERAVSAIAKSGADDRHPRLIWLADRDLAFVCWRLVDRQKDRPDAVQLLNRAVGVSESAMDAAPSPSHRLSAGLNLLYYYVDLVERVQGTARDDIVRRARDLLAKLAPQVDLEKSPVSRLDTMMRAEYRFGDRHTARSLALLINQRLRSKMGVPASEGPFDDDEALARLSRDERRIFLFSQQLGGGA